MISNTIDGYSFRNESDYKSYMYDRSECTWGPGPNPSNYLAKIEIVKQKLYENGQEAYNWELYFKKLYKDYQYKGPPILKNGNTELFTEDIIKRYYESNNID